MTRAPQESPLYGLEDDSALRTILEGTATETGERFFAALVQNLARALKTDGAWVTEYIEPSHLHALAFWFEDRWVDNFAYDIAGTPCEPVVRQKKLIHIADNIVTLYPRDADLPRFGAVSYLGAPLTDTDGRLLGHLAVLDSRPMPEAPRAVALFRIFAARAAAELQRLRAETQVREREEKLRRLVDSAMDAIVEIDAALRVTRVNPAAEKLFGATAAAIVEADVSRLLGDESLAKLRGLIDDLDARPEGARSMWVQGGLQARGAAGFGFTAEASLSRFEIGGSTFHTLILRNVDERLEAERRIRSLTVEAESLREELSAMGGFGDLVGASAALRAVLEDIAQVASTDATVLILGETGTGKELVARALHAASRRSGRPLVRVNCAAIPATLVESEFFGHEAGAFTGATKKRDGRFALADGGTIFLDEIGELPLDLQAKLLRVLQEGEFEPVGSSQTKRIDVRVLAATNRDLGDAVRAGTFREDLYYRLNVFPLRVPPLRARQDDIPLLANTFAQRFGERMGRRIEPLSTAEARQLVAYDWPGNVRELQNAIERAVITSRDGRLNLARALPELAGATARDGGAEMGRVRTAREIEALERENFIRALEQTGWRVAGENGAATLLGMKASTMSSRLKALGIRRPRD